MSEITPEVYQLGAVAIIFLFFLKEFFSYLKGKKPNGKETEKEILAQVQLATANHLVHIQNGIEKLNCTINEGNTQIIALLSEIKGILSK